MSRRGGAVRRGPVVARRSTPTVAAATPGPVNGCPVCHKPWTGSIQPAKELAASATVSSKPNAEKKVVPPLTAEDLRRMLAETEAEMVDLTDEEPPAVPELKRQNAIIKDTMCYLSPPAVSMCRMCGRVSEPCLCVTRSR